MHSTEFRGIPIVIEWPKGSERVGVNPEGEKWKRKMYADYGYIPDTTAAGDEEKVDVYIGPDKDAEFVYVVEQNDDKGEFDEYKVMLGYDSLEDAEASYLAHYDEGWEDTNLGEIYEVPFEYLFDTVQKAQEAKTAASGNPIIDAFVKLYKHEVDFYDQVAHQMRDTLDEALQEAGIRAIVTHRAKRPHKLYDKLVKRNKTRNYQSFSDIYADIVDLAGVRVALYLPADREAVGKIIEQLFVSVRPAKHFPEDRDADNSMGYVATHYLVQLRPETLHKDELRYADTNVEIQIASVLMHAWAEVTHDLIYKPEKGKLTEPEMQMLKKLNDIVQAGEATLEQLQESVEGRQKGDLRFDITSALTKLAERLALQSQGKAASSLTVDEVAEVAKQAAAGSKSGAWFTYLKARTAVLKVHRADAVDDRLKDFWKTKEQEPEGSMNQVQQRPASQDDPYWLEAVRQVGGGERGYAQMTPDEQKRTIALAQQLKTQTTK
jgi:ppGpp synthetase/RelA/SpoT-type nucleotidyltranferase